MDRSQRRFLAWMSALAVVCAAAQAYTGVSELALYLTPFFLVVTLLLSGRYLGEDRIVRLRTAAPRRVRRTRPRWAHVQEAALASLLSRSPVRRRRPPPLAARAA